MKFDFEVFYKFYDNHWQQLTTDSKVVSIIGVENFEQAQREFDYMMRLENPIQVYNCLGILSYRPI